MFYSSLLKGEETNVPINKVKERLYYMESIYYTSYLIKKICIILDIFLKFLFIFLKFSIIKHSHAHLYTRKKTRLIKNQTPKLVGFFIFIFILWD